MKQRIKGRSRDETPSGKVLGRNDGVDLQDHRLDDEKDWLA
jgi:hypothetical protein